MAILKLEINTDDIFSDYDDSVTFEDLFTEAIRKEVTKAVFEKVAKVPVEEETEKIKIETESAIEKKLENLINEDLAFVNGWGKATFVGSIEDYIKQQIDERIMKTVDNEGRPTTGCHRDGGQTWVQYIVKKEIDYKLKQIKEDADRIATRFCKEALKEEIEKFKTQTLKGLVIQQLESVGVLNK